MTCEGCATAIKRILGRMELVTAVETDVAGQRVVVKGAAPPAALLEALQKWGAASGKSVALLPPQPAGGAFAAGEGAAALPSA